VCTHPNGDAAPQALFEITFTEGRFNKRILASHLTGGIGPGRRLVKAGALGTGAILAVDFPPVPKAKKGDTHGDTHPFRDPSVPT
jgi:hypothetical protein